MSQQQLRQANISSQAQARAIAQQASQQLEQAQARAIAQQASQQLEQAQADSIASQKNIDLHVAAEMAFSGKGESNVSQRAKEYSDAITWGDTSGFSPEEQKILNELHTNLQGQQYAQQAGLITPTISEKLKYEYDAFRGNLGTEAQKEFLESLAPIPTTTQTTEIRTPAGFHSSEISNIYSEYQSRLTPEPINKKLRLSNSLIIFNLLF